MTRRSGNEMHSTLTEMEDICTAFTPGLRSAVRGASIYTYFAYATSEIVENKKPNSL